MIVKLMNSSDFRAARDSAAFGSVANGTTAPYSAAHSSTSGGSAAATTAAAAAAAVKSGPCQRCGFCGL